MRAESDARERFKAKALKKARDQRAVIDAINFLAFKIRAVNFAHRQLAALNDSAGSAHIEQEAAVGPRQLNRVQITGLTFNERAAFLAHVMLDLYLFEIVSIRDAVLQLVNVLFPLGIDPREVKPRITLQTLKERIASGRHTGLEEALSTKHPWFEWLRDLRNRATHRHLLEIKTVMPSVSVGGDEPTRGTTALSFWIRNEDGVDMPLIAFMDRVEERMDALLDSTCDDLTELLNSLPPESFSTAGGA